MDSFMSSAWNNTRIQRARRQAAGVRFLPAHLFETDPLPPKGQAAALGPGRGCFAPDLPLPPPSGCGAQAGP